MLMILLNELRKRVSIVSIIMNAHMVWHVMEVNRLNLHARVWIVKNIIDYESYAHDNEIEIEVEHE